MLPPIEVFTPEASLLIPFKTIIEPWRDERRSVIRDCILLHADDQIPTLLHRGPVRLKGHDRLQNRFPKCQLGIVVGYLKVHGSNGAHAGSTPVSDVTIESTLKQQKWNGVTPNAGFNLERQECLG